jgi:hypothetical protein
VILKTGQLNQVANKKSNQRQSRQDCIYETRVTRVLSVINLGSPPGGSS